jgi:hypothetical protein
LYKDKYTPNAQNNKNRQKNTDGNLQGFMKVKRENRIKNALKNQGVKNFKNKKGATIRGRFAKAV